MKTIAHIGVSSREVGPSVIKELVRVFPEGAHGKGFRPRIDETDPRFPELLATLSKCGLQRWNGKGRRDRSREYRLERFVEYEPADFEACEYFQLGATHWLDFWPRDDTGRAGIVIRNDVGDLPESEEVDLAATSDMITAPDRVCDILDDGEFAGLTWRDTVLLDEREWPRKEASWNIWAETWYELRSTITLPPMAPTVILRDLRTREPVEPGHGGDVFVQNEGWDASMGPEFHYRRNDIEAVDFDVAFTYEHHAPGDSGRWIVVSRRFFDYVHENGLRNFDWIPVRVVD